MFEGILGHKKQLEFLENGLERGKLAHAFIFAGPEGIGKKTIAMKLAHELIGSDKDFHPDLLEINSNEGIKIEQIRDLIYKLALKPYSAKYKVAVINHADEMTTEAANALLKSLEEPKNYTYIILITSNAQRLPKTILSRAQKITFGVLERPEEVTEESSRAAEFYKIFTQAQLADKLIAAYDIADLETSEIKNILDLWLKILQTELHISASKNLAQKISQVALSRRYLDQNVNSKLLLTNLMINT